MSIEFLDPVDSTQNIESTSTYESDVPATSSKTNLDQSTIEASKLVAALLVPLMSVPTLIPPDGDHKRIEGLGSILASMSERKKMDFLFGLASQMGEITTNLNHTFMDSLERIIEETRRILNSVSYKDEQETRRANHVSTLKVDESTSPSILTDKIELKEKITQGSEGIINSIYGIDQLSHDMKGIEKIDIPFTVLFAVAGTLALGKMDQSNEAAGDIIKLIERIHPLVPQVKVEEILPVINLMVMAPLIFRPLDEEIQNQKGGQQVNHAKLVQNFAKDVLKMITDPSFALLNIVNNIEQMEHLSEEQKQQFVALLKLILASVALSLLYSLDVGKIHEGKFLGMEPIEFVALLDPDQPLIKPKNDKPSTEEKLIHSLINQVRVQLGILPFEERSNALDGIFDFLQQSYRVDRLLDPAKVLTNVLQGMNYKIPLAPYMSV